MTCRAQSAAVALRVDRTLHERFLVDIKAARPRRGASFRRDLRTLSLELGRLIDGTASVEAPRYVKSESEKVVPPAGFEPATRGLGNRCSVLLSYGGLKARPIIAHGYPLRQRGPLLPHLRPLMGWPCSKGVCAGLALRPTVDTASPPMVPQASASPTPSAGSILPGDRGRGRPTAPYRSPLSLGCASHRAAARPPPSSEQAHLARLRALPPGTGQRMGRI